MRGSQTQTTENFLNITTLRELAECLGVGLKNLTFYLYIQKDDEKYSEFAIKKRSGGVRKIIAPVDGLKSIQRRLNKILIQIYPVKNSVHGFVLNKSIKTNAKSHLQKRYLVNIDLKDFFPSINFGRVRGIFLAHPFNFNSTIATALAQICCYKGYLPQGAPTSPIISNFICRKLDNSILRLIAMAKCSYTRYADDITISTNRKILPLEIGVISNSTLIISHDLQEVIEGNGFNINSSKIRYATRVNRQEVTGLIVNNKTLNVTRRYIRRIRSMLHAWETYGVASASMEFFAKHNIKLNDGSNPELTFRNVIVGRVGFVGYIKGKDDDIYRKLFDRVAALDPSLRLQIIKREAETAISPILYGEGKTDCRHLKKAYQVLKKQGELNGLDLEFHEYENSINVNNDQLLEICKSFSIAGHKGPLMICIFDRDDAKILEKVTGSSQIDFKRWAENVYSMVLPIPKHRGFNEICIEHYYLDEELKRADEDGRRIYLSNEFNWETGYHYSLPLKCASLKYVRKGYPRILDSGIINEKNENVALSKSNFSNNILNDVVGFHDFTFFHFKDIFLKVKEIIELSKVREEK